MILWARVKLVRMSVDDSEEWNKKGLKLDRSRSLLEFDSPACFFGGVTRFAVSTMAKDTLGKVELVRVTRSGMMVILCVSKEQTIYRPMMWKARIF